MCDSVGIKPLRGFFPSSAGHHQNEANRHSAGADAVFCDSSSLTKASFRRYAVSQKIAQPSVARFALFRDSVGIRTQDPQLRRLLLYPAELPNQTFLNWSAKIVIIL